MRGESTKTGRTSYRRLVGAAGGFGALAIAAIMTLSPMASAGIAHPASFPGAYWSPFTYRDNSGCAQAHAFPAHWTALTGAGKWHGSAAAKTCPAYRGGVNVTSEGIVESELSVYAPVTLPSGTGGVNVSWNLNYAIAVSGGLVGTNYNCPAQYYNYSYNFGYTYFNITEIFANCEAGANADLFGFAYLHDMTSGSYMYPSNYWTGVFNDSGTENFSEYFAENYSNSSYWGSNYTYSYAFNGTVGGAVSYSAVSSPTWFINGTFVSTDSYQVITYVGASLEALAFGFANPAHGSSSVNMATGAHHEDLLPIQIW